MACIHLVAGEKGGTGKSWFARLLGQYCRDRHYSISLFDADVNNPDAFPESENGIINFDFHEDAWSHIGQVAQDVPCLVNLPPRELSWLQLPVYLDVLQGSGISFCLWWVTDGSPANVRQLRTAVESFQPSVQWVLVRNLSTSKQWDDLDSDTELNSRLLARQVTEIYFPKIFPDPLILEVERQQCSMEYAVSQLSLIASSKLRHLYEQIDQRREFFQKVEKANLPHTIEQAELGGGSPNRKQTKKKRP